VDLKQDYPPVQHIVSMPAGERRRVCETWVSTALEDAPGVDTPLATLYNAYIKAHPESYLDIAQVGKVLKAKYPNRKHRRGKQGSQLYVYRDVAIKRKDTSRTTVPSSNRISENAIPLDQSQNENNPINGSSLSTIKVNIPGGTNLEVQNFTWAAECNSKGEAVSSDVSTSDEESIPKDMPLIEDIPKSKMVEKRRRDLSSDNKSSRRLKRRRSYYYDETYRVQKICHTENIKNIHAKKTRSKDVEKKSIINPEQVEFLNVLGMQHISTANAPHKRKSHRIRNSPKRIYRAQPSVEDNDSKIVINNKVTEVDSDHLEVSNQLVSSSTDTDNEENNELVTSSTDENEFDSKVGSLCKSTPIFSAIKKECSSPLLESKENIISTKLELPTEVELHETPTVINEFYKQEQDLHNSDQKSFEYDVIKSRQNRSDIEAFRKSVGRQWIDDHIRQKDGVVTTAAEVCSAYNKDHPEAQLTQTNLSMIIRSKFPQRYKLHGTEYVYQDLQFVKDRIPDEEKKNINTIPEFTAPPRHRKPKESLLSQEINSETRQLSYNNIQPLIEQQSYVEQSVSPLHLSSTLDIKPQPSKPTDVIPQNQFKSTYTSSVINYNGVPYIAVLGIPNVSVAQDLSDFGRNVSYPSNVEECPLDLTVNKSHQNLSSMEGKISESKILQEPQYSHNSNHINRRIFHNEDKTSENNLKDQLLSDHINYRSYVKRDEHIFTDKEEMFIDDEEPNLIIDEDYEPNNENVEETNREEIFSKDTSKVHSTLSSDMDVDDYIKGEVVLNKNVKLNSQHKKDMIRSYNFSENILTENEVSYLGTVDKSAYKYNKKESDRINNKFESKKDVDKTGPLNLMKDDIRNYRLEVKPNITNSAIINKYRPTDAKIRVKDSFDNRDTKSFYLDKVSNTGLNLDSTNMKKKESPIYNYGNTARQLSFSNLDLLASSSLKFGEQVNSIKRSSHDAKESDGLKNPRNFTENHRENMNLSVLRRVLFRALSMTSANGLELSSADRAKEMEQSVYLNNSAVSYSIPCVWPSMNSRNPKDFPCQPAAGIQAILLRTTDDQLMQLLLHHQQCPGLGCRNCQPLRAAMVHLMIHRHRCQIWLTLMMLIARHSRDCKLAKCSVEFCLFVKHHIHLSGEPILAKHSPEEQQLLAAEFRKCREAGVHGHHMNCNHRLQWQIPRLSDTTPVPRTLQLLTDILPTDGECESRIDPVIATLQVASFLPIHSV
ncbi:unnamed protein product, partial [Meganyctiphanes norvegica]